MESKIMNTLPSLIALSKTPEGQEKIRVMVAELAFSAESTKGEWKFYQQPEGTEGYRCDLSRLWIYQDKAGVFIGMNYKTKKECKAGAIKGFDKPYTSSLDAIGAVELSNEFHIDGDKPKSHLYWRNLLQVANETGVNNTHCATALQRSIATILTLQKP
jgi:hypothetical protein